MIDDASFLSSTGAGASGADPGIGVWSVGPDLRVRGSQAVRTLLGLGPDEAPTLADILQRLPLLERGAAASMVHRAVDLGEGFDLDAVYQAPDGAVRRLRISAHPVHSLDGAVIAMAGSIALAGSGGQRSEADAGARSLVRQSLAPLALVDPSRRFICVSASLETVLGMAAGELENQCIDQALSWAPERWRRAVSRGLLGDSTHIDADSITLPSGQMRSVRWSVSPWRSDAGDVLGVMLSILDVTELVDARTAIQMSRQRMEFGLEMSDMLICEFDLERRTVAIEGDWKQFFPHAPTFSLLTGDEPCVPTADRERLAGRWVAHLGGDPPYAEHYRVQMADGREIWQAVSVRILRSAVGVATRVMAVIQNITDRKRSEVQLRNAEQRARVAAAAKGDFLANMSHEIRTPLNGVLAVADMLKRTQLDAGQAEMVRLVATSSEMLLKVMDDIVEYTRIEADTVELETRPFDLEAALRTACEAGGHRAEAKGLTFDCFVSAALDGVFRGDPVRIGQVVGHLLGNAVKFTDAGSVRFSATAVETPQRTDVTLTVSDTGPGFDTGFAERMFDQFEQADASTSRRHGGLGLGLSIVKRLVDLMGGRISARSEPGEGATFEVVLPLVRDRIATLGSPRAVPVEGLDMEVRLERLRVLVAEDNPMNRRVVELLLAQSGMVLEFAENGREALDRFIRGKFDVVLMDLQMPVMDGLAAMRAIRDHERTQARPRTPMLALSANASDVHVREAREAGADDHVSKPIVREVLFEAIARYARKASVNDTDIDLDDLDLAV